MTKLPRARSSLLLLLSVPGLWGLSAWGFVPVAAGSSTRSIGPSGSQAIAFDDSAPDRVRLSNGFYKLALNKTNGAILAILDKGSGASLTLGSRNGCLWGAIFPGDQFVGGCSYSNMGQPKFGYSWNASNTTLNLNYTWTAGDPKHLNATVVVTPSSSSYFDMRLSIQNSYRATLKSVTFPCVRLFAGTDLQFAYGAFALPGIRLNPGFSLVELM